MIWTKNAARRQGARIPVESLCAEVAAEEERFGLVVDLSEVGVRIDRPLSGRQPRVIQLEFEIPEIDELMWAKGETCFDRVRPSPHGIVRTTGVRLVAAATRHLRMLREFVVDRRERLARALAEVAATDALLDASHWRG